MGRRHLNPALSAYSDLPARNSPLDSTLLGTKLSPLDPWNLLNDVTRVPQCRPRTRVPVTYIEHLYIMSSGSLFPEYYVLLEVPQSATTEEIRAAYKRESLRYVPCTLPVLYPNPRLCSYSIYQRKILIRLVS